MAITIAGVTRELETLVALDRQFDSDEQPHDWPAEQRDHITERKEELENVVASLEPQSLEDCALMALILCTQFDCYASPHASQDEDREDRAQRQRIERSCNALARCLCQMSTLSPQLIEYYTSEWDRLDWPTRAVRLQEVLNGARQREAAANAS